MKESDPVSGAARAAIARAKRRGDEEVTADDLLAGALGEVARFGIALIGPWAMDVRELEDARPPAIPDGPDSASDAPSARGPRYGDTAVATIEEAARLSDQEDGTTLRLVHLLAALGEREDGLMAALRERYGFTAAEWRAALARGEVGAPAGNGGPASTRPEPGALGATTPELLDVDQAASLLGVHAQTVRNYIRSGKLPAYRLAGERFIRVLRRDLMELLEPVATEDPRDSETELPLPLQ